MTIKQFNRYAKAVQHKTNVHFINDMLNALYTLIQEEWEAELDPVVKVMIKEIKQEIRRRIKQVCVN